jgi:VIT1/CCC1 family predicted Fe2+/Mn2+ transporter
VNRSPGRRLREASPLQTATTVFELMRPHFPEATDGILTSAGLCEGFAGAGVSSSVLLFAGFAGLVAGTLAMGAVEYSKLQAERDGLAAQLAAERALLETAPDAELDELTGLYVLRGLSPGLAIVLIPGPSRAPVTFVIVLAALVLTGWVSARIAQVHPVIPMIRTASIGGLSMLITYLAGHVLYP